MELHRLGVKFFAADPESIRLDDIIPVFHGWIQQQAVPEHLLIDIHDYSHMQNGPGIVLVAHEGNFSIDMSDGRPGLLYYRKTPTALTPAEHVKTVLKSAQDACRLLEKDARMRFRPNELLVIANDRLHAPNDDATFTEFKPVLGEALGNSFELTRVSTDPKERLTILARS
jgi:hypothetical protein